MVQENYRQGRVLGNMCRSLFFLIQQELQPYQKIKNKYRSYNINLLYYRILYSLFDYRPFKYIL